MRAVRASTLPLVPLVLLVPSLLAACSGATPPPPEPPLPALTAALPGPAGAPPLPVREPAPKPMRGLEDIELDAREAAVFWQLVSQLYAPCQSEAVSIRQCVEESRACGACLPAARLLAEKVRQGVDAAGARELYGLRFGPDVKQVDVADSPSRGPADAPVTIVVWSDFECPHCRHAMPYLDRALEKHAPRVRLVHKMYPLSQHTYARGAARAAIAAQQQGKYWEMERVLFAHQSAQTDADLDRYASDMGLDMKRFHADLASPKVAKILDRDHEDAARFGLASTPFILINGREFRGEFFKLDPDLDAWIELEIRLAGAAKPR